MNRLFRTTVPAAGLAVAALLSGGCSSTIDSADLRDDWTPELYSVTMSKEQQLNARTRHRNNNWRQVHDDWAMIWFEEDNLNLTRYRLP